jgi:anthranilate synthase component 2
MDKNILIIDNYDSFTYNLVHIVKEILGKNITVVKNDEIEFNKIDIYTHIILSPGPGIPEEAGDLLKLIEQTASSKKIFGVCLGMQAMGLVFGARLKNLNDVYHGKRTLMYKTNSESCIFNGIEKEFYAGRYHSWVIDNQSKLDTMHINAIDENGEIMAISHKDYHSYGVQFHPESIMTDHGKMMIQNFLNT